MDAIYQPNGAAREYSPLALNLYRGCSHGCSYCYAPSCLRMSRDEFSRPSPRSAIIPALKKQMLTWDKNDARNVLLCFTSDPYQPLERQAHMTRQALELMDGRVKSVSVLTKAADLVSRDFDIMGRNESWSIGATITQYTDAPEPSAADPRERFKMIMAARQLGIDVWISVEPVLCPEKAIEVIGDCIDHGIPCRVGKWNHSTEAAKINWREFLAYIIDISNGHDVYIKDELAKFGNVPPQMRKKPFG